MVSLAKARAGPRGPESIGDAPQVATQAGAPSVPTSPPVAAAAHAATTTAIQVIRALFMAPPFSARRASMIEAKFARGDGRG
jgi:hypothetical protein